MYFGLLHRMIFMELTKVFLLSLVCITTMLLLGGVVGEATRNGLSPVQILMMIPLIVPTTLPYTIPATTLFAACVVYGRLAHDNEILALKAAGVNLVCAVWPGAFLGIIVSSATLGMYFSFIPWTEHRMRICVMNDIEEYMYSMLRRDGKLLLPGLNYEIHVHRVVDRKLINARFLNRSAKENFVASTREAEIHVDLAQGKILIDMRHCWVEGETGDRTYLEHKVWPVDLPKNWSNPDFSHVRAMNWQFLLHRWDTLLVQKARINDAIQDLERRVASGKTSAASAQQEERDNREGLKYTDHEIHLAITELHKRPALALGCLCFVLVGCPIGIWFNRGDYLSAFITCFLPIVVLYYPAMLCGLNMSDWGRAPALLAVWAADVFLLVIAGLLFYRLLRH